MLTADCTMGALWRIIRSVCFGVDSWCVAVCVAVCFAVSVLVVVRMGEDYMSYM